MVGFCNNFQDHSRILERFLESQAAISESQNKLPEGRVTLFLQLVSDFKEASRNFRFSSQKDSQKF
jgi:hypothetical protein